ncbi:MAG: hypothetical protein HYZ20_17855 [Burkholderiales bacterium]|nr:hypothetical protein [Burkholderiales bacterium]
MYRRPAPDPAALDSARPPARALARAGVGTLLLGLVAATLAADPPAATTSIFTCIDERGRRLTSDRPIAECRGTEQRVLNRDGSLKAVLPPTLTADERAAKEARERREAERRAAQADAVRRDRNLMMRYPDAEAHRRAREAALDPVRLALQSSQRRMADLERDRKPLLAESEFYLGKPLPPRLREQIDANEAAMAAQRSALQTQEAETERINGVYDQELARLRQLWAGAAPGSLGPVAAVDSATPRR